MSELLRRIVILEKKMEMLEEYNMEISHYISRIDDELDRHKEVLAEIIEEATADILQGDDEETKTQVSEDTG